MPFKFIEVANMITTKGKMETTTLLLLTIVKFPTSMCQFLVRFENNLKPDRQKIN